jgi:dolichol-phosphate mannosyltransferase
VPDATPGAREAWVILPTYNEAENLERIVGAVFEQLPESGRVLVVDDNSPDGTGEIAERLADSNRSISVLHRPRKEGLGPAYLAGFHVALDAGAQRIVEMDADFSHDPAYLPRLIGAADHYDLVIGSRYVAG